MGYSPPPKTTAFERPTARPQILRLTYVHDLVVCIQRAVSTIGHSTRTIGEFIQLLQEHGVTNGNAERFIQTRIRRLSGGENFFESRTMRITPHSGHAFFGSY